MSPATRCCVSPLMLLLKGESGAAGVVSPDDPEMMQAALSWFLGTPRGANSRDSSPYYMATPPSTPRIGTTSALITYPDGTPRRSRRSHCQCSPHSNVTDSHTMAPHYKKQRLQTDLSMDESHTPYTNEFIKFINNGDLTHRRLLSDYTL